MKFEQAVKIHLVALAEYLQCPPLSDMQIRMYAADLVELGPEGLERAIALLKADPEVWAGRMPLPAKLKQYANGDIRSMAIESARRILSINSVAEAYTNLKRHELEVAISYGLTAIVGRLAEQSPTIFAQLRDSLVARMKIEQQERVASGISGDHQKAISQALGSAELPGEAGESGELQAGLPFAGEGTWPD